MSNMEPVETFEQWDSVFFRAILSALWRAGGSGKIPGSGSEGPAVKSKSPLPTMSPSIIVVTFQQSLSTPREQSPARPLEAPGPLDTLLPCEPPLPGNLGESSLKYTAPFPTMHLPDPDSGCLVTQMQISELGLHPPWILPEVPGAKERDHCFLAEQMNE